jgi:two-component system, cell cycle response regulator
MLHIRVLSLEDDDDDADLLAFALSQISGRSYDITRARSFSEFESLVTSTATDIVISDLHLADRQGLETVHGLLHAAGNVPILLLTGNDDQHIGLKAVEAGVQDFIPKSERLTQLLPRAIDFAIQRGRLASIANQRALTDPLTGLGNRAAFEQRLDAALGRYQRYGVGFALAFIDLDGFKGINDTLGHAAGDEVLRVVSDRARSVSRASDFVCRLGGDEFVVLLDGIATQDASIRAASHFAQYIETPIALACCVGQRVSVGASLGVALCPDDGTTDAVLTTAADRRMYANKASRKSPQRTGT